MLADHAESLLPFSMPLPLLGALLPLLPLVLLLLPLLLRLALAACLEEPSPLRRVGQELRQSRLLAGGAPLGVETGRAGRGAGESEEGASIKAF